MMQDQKEIPVHGLENLFRSNCFNGLLLSNIHQMLLMENTEISQKDYIALRATGLHETMHWLLPELDNWFAEQPIKQREIKFEIISILADIVSDSRYNQGIGCGELYWSAIRDTILRVAGELASESVAAQEAYLVARNMRTARTSGDPSERTRALQDAFFWMLDWWNELGDITVNDLLPAFLHVVDFYHCDIDKGDLPMRMLALLKDIDRDVLKKSEVTYENHS